MRAAGAGCGADAKRRHPCQTYGADIPVRAYRPARRETPRPRRPGTHCPDSRFKAFLRPSVRAGLLSLALAPAVAAGPEIQEWQTERGSRVLFVESRELPIVDVKLVFDAGSARDPADRSGLARLASSLLDEGAGGLDAEAVSYEFERLGAQYHAESGFDSAAVALRSLAAADKLRPAVDNLARVIARPDFPRRAVARQKKRFLAALREKRQSPAAIARDAFFAALYAEHPYARPAEGAEADLEAVDRADIRRFYRRHYTAANALLVLVGALSRGEAEAVAEKLTHALPRGAPPPPLPPVSPPASAAIRIPHPSTQVHVLLGQPALAYGDKDYFPLYVGNQILGGGGMVSRLFEEIRDRQGLSYSVYSYFAPRRVPGPFTAGLQTRGGRQQEALALLREMIAEYIRSGPSEEELRAAKLHITGGFPLRLDSNAKILDYAAAIGFYGLPLDYLETYVDRVNAVTVDEIRQAFARRLDPERFVAVLVGPVVTGEGTDGAAAAGESRAERAE